MKGSYAVVWREGEHELTSGRLEVRSRSLALGPEDGGPATRELSFDAIEAIRIGRRPEHLVWGRPSLVIEPGTGETICIASIAQPGIVFELAKQLVGLQLADDEVLSSRHVLVVVPLRDGSTERARELLASGPPFDPEHSGLTRHEVFLLDGEAIFLFEASAGMKPLEALLAQPDIWRSASVWQEIVAGPPRIAENAFSWHAETA